jgi:oligopeptide transport system substrate-binding protein
MLAAAMFVAACGQTGETQQVTPSADNTLRRGNYAEPESLDPALADVAPELNIVADLMIGLIGDNAAGENMPGAAERWETSDDGLIWTFHLRPHQWSDGMPVTAEDFVYAWRRALLPETASEYASILYVFKNAKLINEGALPPDSLGARVIDADTVELTLEHPVPYLQELLSHVTSYPVPRHVVEALGRDWARPGNYVGNGPYTLAEWQPSDHITLTKNPRFYDAENVKIARVEYYPTEDYDAALRRFRADELDLQERLPPQQIDWLRANMPDTLRMVPQLRIEYVVFNQTKAPFNDVRVREAISLASDRVTLSARIRRLGEPAAYSIVPRAIANYADGPELPFKTMPYPDRLARAQELMRASGYGPQRRLPARLSLRSNTAAERAEGAALQEMWRAIYVDLEIVPSDNAVFYNALRTGDFDLAKASWGADFNDARNFLFLLMSDSGDGLNYGRYRNQEFDALMRRSDQIADGAERARIMAEAEAIALKDSAWAPLYFWVTNDLVHPHVKGWVSNAMDENRTRWLSLEK